MSKVLLCYEDFSELMSAQATLQKVGFDVMVITTEFSLSRQIISFNPDIVIGYGNGQKVSTVGVGKRLKEMPRWDGKVLLIFPPKVSPDPRDIARLRMDMALEAPYTPEKLLSVLAHMVEQDGQQMIQRYQKSNAGELQKLDPTRRTSSDPASEQMKAEDSIYVSGSAADQPQESQWAKSNVADEFDQLMGLKNENLKVPTVEQADPQAQSVHDELKSARQSSNTRITQYDKFLSSKSVEQTVGSQKSILRTESKKAQKRLQSEWNKEELEKSDQDRRAFTKALFKKND